MKDDKGLNLERRMHSFFWSHGYFVGRNIKMILKRGMEVTDIDVYAIKFDEFLRPMKVAVECKNLEGGFDSVLKLRGISDYYHVDIPIVVRKKIDPTTHDFINSLGMMAITLSHLDELEKYLNVGYTTSEYYELYDLDLSFDAIQNKTKILSEEKSTKDICWRFNESWMLRDPYERFIFHQVIHESIKEIFPKSNEKNLLAALQYSSWNNLLLSALSCVEIASNLIERPKMHRKSKIIVNLMGGEISSVEKGKLVSLVKDIVRASGIPIDEGLFKLEPEYVDRLNELIGIMIQSPYQCQKYLRFLDYLINGQLVFDGKVDREKLIKGLNLKKELIQEFSRWNQKLVEALDQSGNIPKYMTELL